MEPEIKQEQHSSGSEDEHHQQLSPARESGEAGRGGVVQYRAPRPADTWQPGGELGQWAEHRLATKQEPCTQNPYQPYTSVIKRNLEASGAARPRLHPIANFRQVHLHIYYFFGK